jgi:hypothetical protein
VLLVLAALVVAAAVAILLVLTGSGGSGSSATNRAASNTSLSRRARAIVSPASVTVAVLNGTASNGLAHRVALRLTDSGYKEGTVETAPDQTHSSTVVAYLPGFRRDARAVASTLKLSSGSIQPVDPSTQAVACPPPAACTANVVVTVGADLANTP